MEQFDVIVVGAGPAGSTAALRLAQGGANVLLLDKAAEFPREKPCAGGITARALQRFPYLNQVFAQIDVNPSPRVQFASPAGAGFTHSTRYPQIYLVRRWEFDAALFRRAQTQVTTITGALVQFLVRETEGVRVTLADGREFFARMVIGADSVNSLVAREMGLRSGTVRDMLAIDVMEETPTATLAATDQQRTTLLLRAGGYGYIFPKLHHTNLGVCCIARDYAEETNSNRRQHHEDWVNECVRRGLVKGCSDTTRFRAFPIPVGGPQQTYADRVLLAGDAGGFVNAFSAEGIVFAMISGEHAADAALAALRAKTFTAQQLRSYEQSWKAEIGEELERAVEIKNRIYDNQETIERLMRAAERDPQLARHFAEYSMGAAPYTQLRRYMLRHSFPKWMLHKVRSYFRPAAV